MESSFDDNYANHLDYGSFQTHKCSLNHETPPIFGASSIGTTTTPPSIERPSSRQLKLSPSTGSSSQIMSFGNSPPLYDPLYPADYESTTVWRNSEGLGSYSIPRAPDAIARVPLSAKDHVMAERKRREKLSQRFIALSEVIPGLKKDVYMWLMPLSYAMCDCMRLIHKMDKASVLTDAAKYAKQLQERVKNIEDDLTRKTIESVVIVKKSKVERDASNSSSEDNSCNLSEQQLPEVEARVSGKHVLIRIQVGRREGIILEILNRIEKIINLSVLSNSVIPFGSTILDITIAAQMDDEFSMTVEDLVRNIYESLLGLI